MNRVAIAACVVVALLAAPALAQERAGFDPEVESSIQQVLPRMVAWRLRTRIA